MTNLVVGLIGLIIGVALGWLFAQLRASQRVTEATSAARIATERLEAAEKIATDRDALATQFKALSAQTMADQDERAARSAQRTISDAQRLLAPVSLALERLDRRLAEVEHERTAMTASLRQQVAEVSTAGESLRKETASLVTALRKPHVRGAWGEMQLQRTAEVAGMLDHCDFQTQQTTTAQGTPQRPDMTVKLSGGRCIHVDAKTPLAAFLDAAQCDDADEYDAQMARFARHVRTHIDQLSAKGYWRTDLDSPEFVVCFLPSDALLQAALQEMPDLHEYANRRGIVVASPSVLIPMLRTVALAWRQEAVARSAADVAALGRDLHKRLGTLASNLDKMGRSLTSTVRAYNSAIGGLETRVLVQARRFEDLEVTTDTLASPTPVDDAVRPLTSPELTEDEP
ncbi:DNA recombination protein RmuC [Cutibacterium sp. WCA-380-WT-3A]|uniref:DNA recombination protein RmuC n=1 Tax=Cutibacterium porci TaxID=2605781 RepID=A0A7K0JA14_9ACTN|nr:DNA recombination protein RmuC [Cutibacterium porci]MSS46720.1 DNA recombination protein RmuC [Cutibacterium porci]